MDNVTAAFVAFCTAVMYAVLNGVLWAAFIISTYLLVAPVVKWSMHRDDDSVTTDTIRIGYLERFKAFMKGLRSNKDEAVTQNSIPTPAPAVVQAQPTVTPTSAMG